MGKVRLDVPVSHQVKNKTYGEIEFNRDTNPFKVLQDKVKPEVYDRKKGITVHKRVTRTDDIPCNLGGNLVE